MHIVTTSSRNFFKKLKKRPRPRLHNAPAFPRNPHSTQKNPNDKLCSGENSLKPDEEIKSLAIIVAEK